jgi:hypothetical protein
MKKIIWLLIAVIVVAGLGIYFLSDRFGGTDAGTENWKTYSNSVLGFEVKYPENWRNEECTYEGFGIVGFGDSSEPLLICNSDAPPLSYVNVQVGAPAAEFDRLIQNTLDNLDNVSRTDTELDGRPAVKIYGEARPSEGPGLPAGIKMTLLFAKEDGKVYSITHWNLENEDHLQEFEKMSSSFKFLGGDVACIQVITSARNPQTGETRDFPTPCDVPEGWQIVN